MRALAGHGKDPATGREKAGVEQVAHPVDHRVGHHVGGHLELLLADLAFLGLGGDVGQRGAEGERVEEDGDERIGALGTALVEAPLGVLDHLVPAILVGGVDVVECHRHADRGDLVTHRLGGGPGRAQVEVDADDREAGAGQRTCRRGTKAAARAQDQRPAFAIVRLAGGRAALLRLVAVAVERTGDRFTVVFDGQGGGSRSVAAAGIRVLYSSARETADDVIKRLASASMTVVSDDRDVCDGAGGDDPVAHEAQLAGGSGGADFGRFPQIEAATAHQPSKNLVHSRHTSGHGAVSQARHFAYGDRMAAEAGA